MKIMIADRKSIEKMSSNVFNDSTALISINDFDDMCVELIHKPNFLLRVAFDDVDNDVIADEGGLHVTEDEIRIIEEKYHMFSDAMAKEISAFYFSVCDKIDCLICQCEHGQSRSAAVAAAILEFRNKKGIKVFASDRYYPNKVVFRKMLMALKNFENAEKRL